MKWKTVVVSIEGRVVVFCIPDVVSDEAYLSQGYVKKQLEQYRQNPELIDAYKKKLVHMAIRHEDNCGIFNRKLCACDTDVQFLGEQPKNVERN